MKTLSIICTLFFASMNIYAQGIQLGSKPDPLPAKAFVFPTYSEIYLSNGLKVYVIEDHEQPTVTMRLQIKGGEISEKIAGTASLTADMFTKGAGKRDALTIAQDLDGIGASITASSMGDLTYINAECIIKHLPTVLGIYSDIIKNPLFPQDEFEKVKTQKLSEVKLEKARPATLLQALARKVSYGQDHPSARYKTEASYKSINLDAIKEFYSLYFRPNNATMAVVGDVKPSEIKSMLEKVLSDWKSGDVNAIEIPKAKPMPQGVYFIARPGSVQSATALTSAAVPQSHPDYEPLRLASNIMGAGFAGRLFKTLRETYSYTYTPYAMISSAKEANRFTCGADVRNPVTDSAITVMQNEMRKLSTEPSKLEEIELIKRYVVGQHKMNFENSDYLANLLLITDYNNQPISKVKEFPERFSAINANQVMNAVAKHISKTSVIVVGSPDILEKLRQFGTVYEYTSDLELKKEESKKVSLTAEQLMENHKKALGGIDKISSITSVIASAKAAFDMGGQQMSGTMTRKQKAPGKDISTVDMQMFKQTMITDGNSAWIVMNGQSKEITDDKKQGRILDAHIMKTARLLELGYKIELKGQEGNSIIAESTDPSGEKETMYFDANTFLIKSISGTKDAGPQGKVEVNQYYSGYQDFGGVKMPTKVVIEQGPIVITMEDFSYQINTEINDSEFKPE